MKRRFRDNEETVTGLALAEDRLTELELLLLADLADSPELVVSQVGKDGGILDESEVH
jgi:hypothetical protein